MGASGWLGRGCGDHHDAHSPRSSSDSESSSKLSRIRSNHAASGPGACESHTPSPSLLLFVLEVVLTSSCKYFLDKLQLEVTYYSHGHWHSHGPGHELLNSKAVSDSAKPLLSFHMTPSRET